ncbi:MAG: hypothetical protein GY898_23165 [Proteobacteria bacterium]|nr:hypothetical protein [Pseudomonadota bacterium]
MRAEQELVHVAPWNYHELHLGPASNCWTCGTWTEPTPAEVDQVLEGLERAEHYRPPSIAWRAFALAVLAGLVAWRVWWTLP